MNESEDKIQDLLKVDLDDCTEKMYKMLLYGLNYANEVNVGMVTSNDAQFTHPVRLHGYFGYLLDQGKSPMTKEELAVAWKYIHAVECDYLVIVPYLQSLEKDVGER